MNITRTRPLRQAPWIRNLLQEHDVHIHDFIYPLFVRDPDISPDIPFFGNVKRWNLEDLPFIADKIAEKKIPLVALFPCVSEKTYDGKCCLREDALIPQAIQKLKGYDFGIMTDIALDPYTTHGHDGILNKDQTDVENEETVSVLVKQALLYAEAGADVVAPSDMMDGRIYKIRETLNGQGYQNVLIFSYAAKFASTLYAPFRSALHIEKLQGPNNKKTYQLPISNRQEAMLCIKRDIEEGAHAIIIKPGCFYLDIVYEASKTFNVPIFVYQVSGEYMMIKDSKDMMMESFMAFKRAGARGIISYGALDF